MAEEEHSEALLEAVVALSVPDPSLWGSPLLRAVCVAGPEPLLKGGAGWGGGGSANQGDSIEDLDDTERLEGADGVRPPCARPASVFTYLRIPR